MKNLIKNLICITMFILVTLLFCPVYSYGDIVIEGKEVDEGKEENTRTNIKVYNLAALIDDTTYELSSDFIDCGYTIDNIKNASASDLTVMAEEIGMYAVESNAEFGMLNEMLCLDITVEIQHSGIYLIMIDNIIYGEITYKFQPIICIANINEDVSVNPKVYLSSGSNEEETTVFPPVTATPTPEPEFPNTGFNIVPVYILVFVGIITVITAFGMKRRNPEQKKYSYFMYMIGILMVGIAAYMLGGNYFSEQTAVKKMDTAKKSIKNIIVEAKEEQSTENVNEHLLLELLQEEDEPMPVCEVDGSKYIGILEIPSLSLELPIGYDCQASTLKSSPGRFAGQTGEGTFVIGAHHYGSQFGYINQLIQGDEIYFTDLNGERFNYKVSSMTQVEPTQVKEVCESGYDLALFTCNYNASKRIIVYCQINE